MDKRMPIFLVMVLISQTVFSQFTIADIFTDNMVLQRNEPISIWGTGATGEQVNVDFSGTRYKTTVNKKGTWEVRLKEQESQKTPQNLWVQSGEDEITLKNILIGDVWLLIGQSNMEWPMQAEMHYEEELEKADNDKLRFYNPSYVGKNIYGGSYNKDQIKKLGDGELFYDGRWEVSDTSVFKKMSAVGYYFGQEINMSENIPVGLINLSIGGAPLETFMDAGTLREDLGFSAKVSGNWLDNNTLPVWIRERGRENIENNPEMANSTNNHAYKPGFAFASAIEPLLKMPIKGVLWYQGESNSQEMERVKEYPDLQQLMIEDYRKKWKNDKLPFYYVQLSSIDTANYDSHYWPEFRDGQRRILNVMENVGMAVSSDIGNRNDVHPRNKKDVGKRLARWALKNEYHKEVLISGPLPQKAEYKKGNIIVKFKYTGSGLKTSDGETVRGFSIDGKTEIMGKIEGEKLIFPLLEKPKYLYYNWQPFALGNLLNSENLPASTFKVEVFKT